MMALDGRVNWARSLFVGCACLVFAHRMSLTVTLWFSLLYANPIHSYRSLVRSLGMLVLLHRPSADGTARKL
ncbi:hypothetical protein V8C37DRAFT_136894 [Trichoderma ceciliae]